jgi:uncharacterized protein (DUF1778 family)
MSEIKFRIPADDKLMLVDAAERAGLTVSDMLRRAGRAAATGRIASRSVLSDLVRVRAAANKLATLLDNSSADATLVAECKAVTEDLRAIVANHLVDVR